LNTVKLSVTACAFTGVPRLVGLPHCDENEPPGFAALKLCVAPAANEPPALERESRIRHGVIGVYTSSGADPATFCCGLAPVFAPGAAPALAGAPRS
jgi:hypothetical protein